MPATVSKASASALTTISALEARTWITKLLIGAVIGICIGAAVGGLFFGALRTQRTATAFIKLNPPADLAAVAASANQVTPDSSDNPEKYVAGEVAYLSGQGFAQAIGKKLGKDGPASFKVAQDSRSSTITVSASAPSVDEAIRTVQAAIDLYGQQLAQRSDQQLRMILPALALWEQTDPTNAQRVGDIQRLRESVQLQAAQASTIIVMQPPTPDVPSALRWLTGVVLGALVAGSCVVLVLMGRRRRSGRGTLVMDVTDAVDGVLVPAVDLRLPPRGLWTDEQVVLARSLYAQCQSPGPSRIVVLVGASRQSGTGVVASLLEYAAAEQGQATTISSAHDAMLSPQSADGQTTLIVDTGALGHGARTPEAIRRATDLVVVARIDADTAASAMAACSAAAAGEVPVMAVFTHRPWRWPEWASRNKATSHAHRRDNATHSGNVDAGSAAG